MVNYLSAVFLQPQKTLKDLKMLAVIIYENLNPSLTPRRF
jgi:hypothetical protein